MRQILAGEVPDPAERRRSYPPELAAIVLRALTIDLDRRYPTAQAFADDLDALARSQRWRLSCGVVGKLVVEVDDRVRHHGAAREGR